MCVFFACNFPEEYVKERMYLRSSDFVRSEMVLLFSEAMMISVKIQEMIEIFEFVSVEVNHDKAMKGFSTL